MKHQQSNKERIRESVQNQYFFFDVLPSNRHTKGVHSSLNRFFTGAAVVVHGHMQQAAHCNMPLSISWNWTEHYKIILYLHCSYNFYMRNARRGVLQAPKYTTILQTYCTCNLCIPNCWYDLSDRFCSAWVVKGSTSELHPLAAGCASSDTTTHLKKPVISTMSASALPCLCMLLGKPFWQVWPHDNPGAGYVPNRRTLSSLVVHTDHYGCIAASTFICTLLLPTTAV